MKKGFILSLGTLRIDNETDDDDASQSRQKGPRISFSAGKTKFKQCSFPISRFYELLEKCAVSKTDVHQGLHRGRPFP